MLTLVESAYLIHQNRRNDLFLLEDTVLLRAIAVIATNNQSKRIH